MRTVQKDGDKRQGDKQQTSFLVNWLRLEENSVFEAVATEISLWNTEFSTKSQIHSILAAPPGR